MSRAERRSVERVVRAAIDGTATEIRPDELTPLHLMPRTGVVGDGLAGDGVAGSGAVQARRGLSRPVAALAAAAAVIAIAGASFGAASALRADRAEVTGPRPAAGALALIPRYSIALVMSHRLDVAEVIDSVTGRAAATLQVPKPYNSVDAITADAGGRTFVLDAQVLRYTGKHRQNPVHGRTQLFMVTLTQKAGPQQFTATPLRLPSRPKSWHVESLALSPDGTRLAVYYDYYDGGTGLFRTANSRLVIYTMASGAARVFRGTWGLGQGPFDPGSTSWAADDKTLTLDTYASVPPRAIELFNADAANGTIASNSRPLYNVRPGFYFPTTLDVRILPAGTKVVFGAYTHKHPNQLAEVSTATGKLVDAIILNPPLVQGAVPALSNIAWTDRSGSVMILQFNYRTPHGPLQPVYMVLHNGKLTPLPTPNPGTLERAW
jgi:hypothetical protein